MTTELTMRRWVCSDSHHSEVVEAISAPLAFEGSWGVPLGTVRVATDLGYEQAVEVDDLDATADWVTLTFQRVHAAASPLVLEVREADSDQTEPEPGGQPSEVLDAAKLGVAVGFRYGYDRQVVNRPDVPTDATSLRKFAEQVVERLLCDPNYNNPVEPPEPGAERVRLFRERILDGMTVEQAKEADEADERGRWGSGVYGCGHGDDWSETLKEVFDRVLGEGWWEQVVAEAEARQAVPATRCGPRPTPQRTDRRLPAWRQNPERHLEL